MRTNSEDAQLYRPRMIGSKRASVTIALTGTFNIPSNGPELYFLDPGTADKSVVLPATSQEFSVLIAHTGTTNVLNIFDSLNVAQTNIRAGEVGYFFSSYGRWVWLVGSFVSPDITGLTRELVVVTAAGAQTLNAFQSGIAVNKSVASVTPVTLPLASSRAGRPIRFVDWSNTVDMTNPVVLTPSGSDKIMNQSSYSLENLGFGGVILFPHTVLGGYTVGG